MMRIILDTNILISGVQDDMSHAYRILQEVLQGKVETIISPAIKKEYERLAKRLITDNGYLNLLDQFYTIATVVHPARRVAASEDPEDNKFLEAAKEARADYLISEDAHLLDLEMFEGTEIVTPERYWNKVAHHSESDDNADWLSWVHNVIQE